MLKHISYSLGQFEQREKDLRIKYYLREASTSSDFSSRSKDIFVRVVYKGGKEQLYRHAIPASYLMERNAGMFVARPEVFTSPHESVLWPEELLLPGHKYFIIPSKAVEKLKRKYAEEGNTNELKGVGQEILDANNTKSPGEQKVTGNGRNNTAKSPRGHGVAETCRNNTANSPSGLKVTENGRIKEPNGVGQETLETKTKLSPGERKVREKGKVEEANGAERETLNSKVNQSQGGASAEESFPSAKEFYVSKDNWAIKKRRGLRGKKPFVPPLPKTISFRGRRWKPSLPTVEELSP
ncbi:hypothetical protein L6164_020544 [Bauhinia variegata]|uniref:Uncharacterized protein n=1 Tax=Bauhinia variegata TaxID=167791 RepID=A0ACB9MVG9_BAUVA|nr:hypothetical protein L6164_020544 [Bauhinia variegata]